MKLVAENDLALSYFTGNLSIISARLLKMSVYLKEESLIIDLDLKLLYSKNNSHFQLRFTNVKEYSFYYNSDNIFYNIENCKFFKNGKFYYLSLDPEDESNYISKNDQDYIVSIGIEAYSMPSLE
jgi:hypothetical protein